MKQETYQDLEPNYPTSDSKKYFTPAIEEIRVGYECEFLKDPSKEEWVPFTIKKIPYRWTNDEEYVLGVEVRSLRVPYLIKEQIEAEGWTYTGRKDYHLYGYDVFQGFHNAFEKSNYVIQGRGLFGSQKYLKVFDMSDQEDGMCVFEGECKDINTFRYITKLLGI